MPERKEAGRRWVTAARAWAQATNEYSGRATDLGIAARDYADVLEASPEPDWEHMRFPETLRKLAEAVEIKASEHRGAYLGMAAVIDQVTQALEGGDDA